MAEASRNEDISAVRRHKPDGEGDDCVGNAIRRYSEFKKEEKEEDRQLAMSKSSSSEAEEEVTEICDHPVTGSKDDEHRVDRTTEAKEDESVIPVVAGEDENEHGAEATAEAKRLASMMSGGIPGVKREAF